MTVKELYNDNRTAQDQHSNSKQHLSLDDKAYIRQRQNKSLSTINNDRSNISKISTSCEIITNYYEKQVKFI